jgi:hypothetical protein
MSLFSKPGLLIIAGILFSIHGFSQKCSCQPTKEKIFSKKIPGDSLLLCGYKYDTFGNNKIISEFTLMLCKKDSILLDQMHNEGAAFLYQQIPGGIAITEIDLQIENRKYIYPETFLRIRVVVESGKLGILKNEVKAEPVISYLKKNFKKITELF